jgi:hypothetical protein
VTNKIYLAYRKVRRHQQDTYGRSNYWINGVDQRQHSGGGAAYGYHAVAAYLSAKAHLHFMARLKRDLGRQTSI